jgi:AAA family ATP:ADP antiporter
VGPGSRAAAGPLTWPIARYAPRAVGRFERLLGRLGIEPSERLLCGWAGLCLALLGASAYGLFNSSETLFLKRVGVEQLPWALLASSGLLVVTTMLASRTLANLDRPRALPIVLMGLAALLLPLWWLLQAYPVPVVFGAFVLMARQILALGQLVFWLALADLVTARQAKRLFGPLAAGITFGAIVGSFGSDPVARLVGVEGLVLVCALLLGGAAGGALWLRRVAATGGAGGLMDGGGRRRADAGPDRVSTPQVWRESRLFRLLMGAMLCGGLLSPVLYFEFSSIADSATVGADAEQRLLALYAQFRGWLNVAMLVVQLWLSGWLYQRIGLPLARALEPASYLLGFGWLGVQPGLLAGVSALGAGRLTEDAIALSALRVLFNLFPERLRSTAAGLLEGPVNRLGAMLGNTAVLAALALGAAPVIAFAAVPIAALWLAMALALWRAYPALLLQASSAQTLAAAGADAAKLLDPGTVRALGPSLCDPDPRVCRAALDLVVRADPGIAVEVLANALTRAPVETRPLLVDALHRLVELLPQGTTLAGDAAATLAHVLVDPGRLAGEERADLLQTYARLTAGETQDGEAGKTSLSLLQRALGDREAAVRLAAIAELHRRGRPPPGVRDLSEVLRGANAGRDVMMRRTARKELRAMLLVSRPDAHWHAQLELLAEGLESRADRAETAEALVEVARQHGGAALACAERVAARMDDRDPRVRAAVLRFSGFAGSTQQIRRLVAALRSRRALVALGSEAAGALLAEIESGDSVARDAVASVLRDLDLDPVALEALYSRQLERVRSAVVLRAALDGRDPCGLVLRRLEERTAEGMGTLLTVVSVLCNDERIGELERRLRRAPDERSRDILVEALEALLPSVARAHLVPLLEGASWERRGRVSAQAQGVEMPSPEAAWDALADDGDPLSWRLARAFAPQNLEARRRMGEASGVLDPMDVAVSLQSSPAFGRLSTQQLVGLAEVLEELRFEAGGEVFAEGDEADGIYFVFEGEVELRGRDTEIERVGPGGLFGELSTLDGVPRTRTARAAGSARLLRLEREELLALMESYPELGIGMSQLLCARVRALQDRLDLRTGDVGQEVQFRAGTPER